MCVSNVEECNVQSRGLQTFHFPCHHTSDKRIFPIVIQCRLQVSTSATSYVQFKRVRLAVRGKELNRDWRASLVAKKKRNLGLHRETTRSHMTRGCWKWWRRRWCGGCQDISHRGARRIHSSCPPAFIPRDNGHHQPPNDNSVIITNTQAIGQLGAAR